MVDSHLSSTACDGGPTAAFQAILLRKEDDLVAARVEPIDESALPPTDVRVRVDYSSLNYKDGLIVNGLAGLVRTYQHVPGIDYAGTGERSDDQALKQGDRVVLTSWWVGETSWDGYAQIAQVDAMPETLAELAGRERSADMIDSTVVRAHHCAVGCDGKGRPLGFVLTPGQAHDVQGFGPLFRVLGDRIEALLADRGYDADAIRDKIAWLVSRPSSSKPSLASNQR